MSPSETHRSIYPLSRLGRFMNVHHLKPMRLAAASGVSRQHIYRLRYGLMDGTVTVMLKLRDGCAFMLTRRVLLSEICDLGEDDILLPLQRSADDRWKLELILKP